MPKLDGEQEALGQTTQHSLQLSLKIGLSIDPPSRVEAPFHPVLRLRRWRNKYIKGFSTRQPWHWAHIEASGFGFNGHGVPYFQLDLYSGARCEFKEGR